jgi:hypothetical protein
MPGAAGVVEIWNEHWSSGSNNEASLQLWYDWLNQGYRVYATVGTDIHGSPDPALEFGVNVIYAEALSESAILSAVRQGNHYMSSGPQLAFTGRTSSGQTALMGESLSGEKRELTVQWQACRTGDRIRLVLDGQLYEELSAAEIGEKTWQLSNGHKHWAVVEARDAQNNMRALTNPIFLKP